jgi:hypothetical protein
MNLSPSAVFNTYVPTSYSNIWAAGFSATGFAGVVSQIGIQALSFTAGAGGSTGTWWAQMTLSQLPDDGYTITYTLPVYYLP